MGSGTGRVQADYEQFVVGSSHALNDQHGFLIEVKGKARTRTVAPEPARTGEGVVKLYVRLQLPQPAPQNWGQRAIRGIHLSLALTALFKAGIRKT